MVAEVLAVSAERDRMSAALLAAEARGYRRGAAEGYAEGVAGRLADVAADQREIAGIVRQIAERPDYGELERRRYHVCCRACRIGGCRPGCSRCQDRTRETFAAPHPDDMAAAS